VKALLVVVFLLGCGGAQRPGIELLPSGSSELLDAYVDAGR
jgi:hypothetical protein